jgi:hypothetical protein
LLFLCGFKNIHKAMLSVQITVYRPLEFYKFPTGSPLGRAADTRHTLPKRQLLPDVGAWLSSHPCLNAPVPAV